MRICLIASSRHPVREPFAGGLEALTHQLATQLVRRGHDVTLFARSGTDPALPVSLLPAVAFRSSPAARRDPNAPGEDWMSEHHSYLRLMMELVRDGADRFDIVHNHSLHHLPIAMAPLLDIPLITTLHTPPVPWLESAIEVAGDASTFTSVSDFTARAWSHLVRSEPILNGVDLDAWKVGPGGGAAVWSGRLVPEKAPHEAIDAARAAGIPVLLAGPTPDHAYFEEYVVPRLGRNAVYVGHLDHRSIALLLAQASVALVTSRWDEPYGLVAAEAMACGTPVAAYARGALPEIVREGVGALATPEEPLALAEAIDIALGCDRREVRHHAESRLSAQRMIQEYEHLYARRAHHRVPA